MADPILNRLKNKSYIHFDPKISPESAIWRGLTKNLSFYPLLHYGQKIRKFRGGEKAAFKIRDIYYAAHFDRYKYAFFAFELEKKYELWLKANGLDENIIAYRKIGLRNTNFAKQVFDHIKKLGKAYVFATDINKFFDTLNHSLLKAKWQEILKTDRLPDGHYTVYKTVSKFAYIDMTELFTVIPKEQFLEHRISNLEKYRTVLKPLMKKNHEDYGIPQGLPISSVLSNIYMLDFDKKMRDYTLKHHGFYRRYSDDIIAVFPEPILEDCEAFVDNALSANCLTRNIGKTEKRYISTEFGEGEKVQYLGFDFDGKQTKIRASSLNRYFKKLHGRIRIIREMQDIRRDNRRFRKRFYKNYTHLGKANFVRYAYKSAEIHEDKAIRRQVRRHWQIVKKLLG